ncbi:MAG TPA: endospore germination permease [Symbiobacteriaceae bacterium]|jgi:spore germination protein (amino acid permease)
MKSRAGQIGLTQGVILVYAILAAKLFIQYPSFLINVGGPAAWQVALIMTGAGLVLFLPMSALARRFPGQGLGKISETVAGPYAGPLLSLTVAAWLFATVVIGLRAFTETFIMAILPTTPPSVLAIVILLCVIYAAHRGIEPLSRATQMLFPVIAAGIFLVLLFSLPRADASRLYPFLGFGPSPTISGGLFYSGIAAEAMVLLVVGHAFEDPESLHRSGLYGILLFGLTAAATVSILVMIFGAPDAAQQSFPMFNLARLVYLGRFLQRTEAFMVMFWIFAVAVRLSALFYAGVVLLTEALRLPWYRPLVYPMAVLAMSLSLLPKDFVTVIRIDRDWLRPLGLALVAIPVVLLVLAAVRRKGGETHAA